MLLFFVCLLTAGCAEKETEGTRETRPPVDAAAEQDAAQSEGFGQSEDTFPTPQIIARETKPSDNARKQRTENIDVDLTVLSSTMVYAEVYNIMSNPDGYVGKTIKGRGLYDNFYYGEMDKYFHYFVISDATGCCPQGLDFVLNGEYSYPEDYPEINESIEVTGIFVKGEAEGNPYYYLAADNIIALDIAE